MNTDRLKIVFLADKYSIVIKGLEKRLKAEGYETEILTEKFEHIGDYVDVAGVFVLYKPEDIIDAKEGKKNLVMIGDQIRDHDLDMIVIGDEREQTEAKKVYPDMDRHTWMERPIDPDKFARTVDEIIEKREKERAEKPKETKVDIPRSTYDAGSSASTPADDKKRILIIDDDPAYAGMVRLWIKNYYHVDVVVGGMQAISFLMKTKVDLILLDYEMPVVDGPQVLQMLRQDEQTADIPVIFLTGVSSEEGVRRVMELKPAGYLLKSSPRDDILAFIKDRIG